MDRRDWYLLATPMKEWNKRIDKILDLKLIQKKECETKKIVMFAKFLLSNLISEVKIQNKILRNISCSEFKSETEYYIENIM